MREKTDIEPVKQQMDIKLNYALMPLLKKIKDCPGFCVYKQWSNRKSNWLNIQVIERKRTMQIRQRGREEDSHTLEITGQLLERME